MPGLYYFIIFVFGTCVGSFLNCVIYRLEKKKSFVKGKSFCPQCRHKLKWYDLIPILSFISLRGRCRYCGKKISWQYPLIEISTGLIFLLIFNFQFSISNQFSIFNFKTLINLTYLLIVSSFLVVIFVYDLKHYIIPDEVIYPVIGLVFLYRLLEVLKFSHFNLFGNWKLEIGNSATLSYTLITALAVAGFFFMLWFFSSGRYMGLGDAKLGFLMGLFLGFPNILVALFLAFLLGAVVGLGLIFAKKKKLKSQLPFGPFLVTGTFIALFWAEAIIRWYLLI